MDLMRKKPLEEQRHNWGAHYTETGISIFYSSCCQFMKIEDLRIVREGGSGPQDDLGWK